MPELSIIIPCRNDSEALPSTLRDLHQVVSHHSLAVETLVIDDGSTDNTVAVATRLAHDFPALHVRVLVRKHLQPGLGGALRYGMAFALGRYCVLLAPDGGDPVSLIPTMLFRLRAGHQLVQCSRHPQADAYSSWRGLLLKPYRAVSSLLIGQAAADTTYSFRAFDRAFAQVLGLSGKKSEVCAEMTSKVLLCGGKIEYVGAPKESPTVGNREVQPLDIWRHTIVLTRAALHRIGLVQWF